VLVRSLLCLAVAGLLDPARAGLCAPSAACPASVRAFLSPKAAVMPPPVEAPQQVCTLPQRQRCRPWQLFCYAAAAACRAQAATMLDAVGLVPGGLGAATVAAAACGISKNAPKLVMSQMTGRTKELCGIRQRPHAAAVARTNARHARTAGIAAPTEAAAPAAAAASATCISRWRGHGRLALCCVQCHAMQWCADKFCSGRQAACNVR